MSRFCNGTLFQSNEFVGVVRLGYLIPEENVGTISVCKFKIPYIDPLRVNIYFRYVGINVAFILLTVLFSLFNSVGILTRLVEDRFIGGKGTSHYDLFPHP